MEQFIFIDHIEARSLVDGPGERTVVFVQGCPIHCPGCQSPHLWNATSKNMMPVFELANTLGLLTKTKNLTIAGGEPLFQPKALAYLLKALDRFNFHTVLYTGYTWEQISSPISASWLWIKEILDRVDILVDGPYKNELDDPFISYRGSRNQRPIDVQETLQTGILTVLDWESPEVVIDSTGLISLPIGLTPEFSSIGQIKHSRMCGES